MMKKIGSALLIIIAIPSFIIMGLSLLGEYYFYLTNFLKLIF